MNIYFFQTYFSVSWLNHKCTASSAPINMKCCVRDSISLRRNWIQSQDEHSSPSSIEEKQWTAHVGGDLWKSSAPTSHSKQDQLWKWVREQRNRAGLKGWRTHSITRPWIPSFITLLEPSPYMRKSKNTGYLVQWHNFYLGSPWVCKSSISNNLNKERFVEGD